ncbi:phosphatase PAP2 family protein [Candidatus Peregrinibacteria bacterium]|nr:phosphatase PAP2 family protein [Candidatus Peregrinibacteria bacterium]
MLFVTDFGLVFVFLLINIYLITHRQYKTLLLLLLSCVFAFEATYLLKLIFQTPRPFFSVEVAIIPLTLASGYSFPSLHTAICFAIIPFLNKYYLKNAELMVATFILLLIAFSRFYLGVHFPSDLIAGALIGYLTAKLVIFWDQKYNLSEKFIKNLRSELEFRRQFAHLLIGLTIVALLYLGLLNATLLLFITIIGGLISLSHKYFNFSIVNDILTVFERPKDIKTFPGKGSFFLILGAFFASWFFPKNIALASIIIMAIGDSVSHLFGAYYGKLKFPYVKEKKVEGIMLAILLSTLGAMFFVNFELAFSAAFLSMILEAYLSPKFTKYLDDNLIIPIFGGIIISILS